ncbi:hypothetical protein SA87_01275 [Hydrogenibacillus schlegelii]|uniref:Uncharacterized protein n=1 Tax=Hydrogenibacillus schlegelii TaxID=1484 RepID=A0A179IPK5_HYDSH|nr:hypothetical protein SA87_01275 [Hydrogenibacillus schlegelii]
MSGKLMPFCGGGVFFFCGEHRFRSERRRARRAGAVGLKTAVGKRAERTTTVDPRTAERAHEAAF